MTQTFVGAQVYLPGEIANTTVTVADGVIVEIGGQVLGSEISAHGKILAPAIIDVHGDAFERQLMPRPGVYFPIEVALIDTDRQLAANGITTVWAIIFVMVVGLGAFAGTLTIMVDTIGFCGRFFAEEMEDVDRSSAEALSASGARRFDTVFAAVVPAATPGLITTSLFAFEKAIRSSVVLGLVGAGGIGLELQSLMNWMAYDRAMVIIGMIFVLVLVVEQLSSYFRKLVMKNA